jgi:hypothetical protein
MVYLPGSSIDFIADFLDACQRQIWKIISSDLENYLVRFGKLLRQMWKMCPSDLDYFGYMIKAGWLIKASVLSGTR